MWGKHRENGVWIAPSSDWRLMFKGHDALYISVWRLKLRLMKFWRGTHDRHAISDDRVRATERRRKLMLTQEQVEQQMVPRIVDALYPIFYPVEQQDCAIQAQHRAKLTEIATQAWRSFYTGGHWMEAADEIKRLRDALEAIKKATLEGRVCDDVAWFDSITTLHDYCDLVLDPEDR